MGVGAGWIGAHKRGRLESHEDTVMNSRLFAATSFVILGLCLSAAPMVAQEVCSAPVDSTSGLPFGRIDAIGQGQNSVSGTVAIRGWAVSVDEVQRVDIYVNGVLRASALTDRMRPDIFALYGEFPNAAFAGWAAFINTTKFPNGLHTITAQAISKTGEPGALSNPLEIQFGNTVHNLVPFGRIKSPANTTQLFGNCDPTDPDRRLSTVLGWALDAGIETNDHGVGYVELLLDGSILANTRRDCHTNPVAGPYTNCYGIPDLEVEREFPGLKDSPNAGFRFVLDVGHLINFGYAEGHHVFTLRVGDEAGQNSNIDTVTVGFNCEDLTGDRGSFGQIEAVTQSGEFVAGIITYRGWALDADGVDRIQVFVDGKLQPLASYGFARPDVLLEFPGFPDSSTAGFIGNLDTTLFADGVHHLTIFVIDEDENRTGIGKVAFQIRNP
jgi:hypothetical protein